MDIQRLQIWIFLFANNEDSTWDLTILNSEKKVVEYGGKINEGYDELVQFIIGYAKRYSRP